MENNTRVPLIREEQYPTSQEEEILRFPLIREEA
jgi:hypothetical protein